MKDRTDRDKRINTAFSAIYFAAIVFVIAIYIKLIYNVEYFSAFDSQEQVLIHILFSIAGLLFVSVVGMLLQTIVHEAGHLIFGLLTGYKFNSFQFLIFELYKKNSKLKFRLSTVPGAAGQCLMIPPNPVNGKYPVQLYYLGGVLMNIISGVALIGVYFAIREEAFSACTILIIAVSGFFFAFTNGIPLRAKINNDGYNAVELSKSIEARLANWRLLKINYLHNNGVEFKDMPDELFGIPESEKFESSTEASLACLICQRLLEKRQFDEADRLMAQLLEQRSVITVYQRDVLLCERIFYELVNQNRREVIEEMRTEEQKEFLRKKRLTPTVMRAEYAYALLAEHDTEKADKIKAKFDEGFGRFVNDEYIKLQLEMMELAKSKADQLH